MLTESSVRESLRAHVLESIPGPAETIYEFWVPQSNERADVVVVGPSFEAFEIKTHRDSLKRLPRQAAAYGRLFERCHAVLAPRHVEPATAMLPEWWGIWVVSDDHTFTVARRADSNPFVDPASLVRLLWRDEAYAALCGLNSAPSSSAGRFEMWQLLTTVLDTAALTRLVREVLLLRDPAQARIPSRRFAVS